jgi:hypothetical protein
MTLTPDEINKNNNTKFEEFYTKRTAESYLKLNRRSSLLSIIFGKLLRQS